MEPKEAWSLPSVLKYFSDNRKTTSQVYESEWHFLKDLLKEDLRVLDIGCAQGGFASVLSEQLAAFEYTGVDISQNMINEAKLRFPQHRFFVTSDNNYSQVQDENFDLVLCLGILHLNSCWREMITEAWKKTNGSLLLDLREHAGETIEDESKSYFRMNFNGAVDNEARIPYVILNSKTALKSVEDCCAGFGKISQYGYLHPVSTSAVTSVKQVLMHTYLVQRKA